MSPEAAKAATSPPSAGQFTLADVKVQVIGFEETPLNLGSRRASDLAGLGRKKVNRLPFLHSVLPVPASAFWPRLDEGGKSDNVVTLRKGSYQAEFSFNLDPNLPGSFISRLCKVKYFVTRFGRCLAYPAFSNASVVLWSLRRTRAHSIDSLR